MDNFDKLIKDKIDQTQHSDADQAWKDFVKYKSKQESAKGGFMLSKSQLWSAVGILLITTMGIIGYYSTMPSTTQNTPIIARSSDSGHASLTKAKDIAPAPAVSNISQPQTPAKAQIDATKSTVSDIRKKAALPIAAKPSQTNKTSVKSDEQLTSGTKAASTTPVANFQSPVSATLPTTLPNQAVAATWFHDPNKSGTPENVISQSYNSVPTERLGNTSTPAPVVVAQKEESALPLLDTKKTVESTPPSTNTPPTNTNLTSNTFAMANSLPNSGNLKKTKRLNLKEYQAIFKRYTDISLYNLENSKEIASILNAQFMSNPANSGYENRFALMTGAKTWMDYAKSSDNQIDGTDLFVANAFPLLQNRMGIGVAINKHFAKNRDALSFNFSSAYNISLSKNQFLRVGIGLYNSNTSTLSEGLATNDITTTSIHAGARYMYKTLYAELYINHLYSINKNSNSLFIPKVPMEYHNNYGGRLFLNKSWAVHPSINLTWTPSLKSFSISPMASLSVNNRWLFGVQTDNFSSVGIHAGCYTGKRLTVLLKSDLYANQAPKGKALQSGELLLKFELGKIHK